MRRGLVHRFDDDGALRIGVDANGDDWLGPGAPLGSDGGGWRRDVDVVDDDTLILRLTTDEERSGIGTGTFAAAAFGWRFVPADRTDGGIPDDTKAVGFQVAEFAFPTRTDAAMAQWLLLPHRPQALGLLLLAAPDGTTLLLGPIDQHEQTIGVGAGDGALAVGWHGDLDRVPAGFSTSFAVVAADGPGAAIDRWVALLPSASRPSRPSRHADALGRRLSYWTDNGASYWYKTEPGHTVTSGLVATVDDLRDRGVPVESVQVDSWWYPHEVLRPFDTDEWVVPPTGMLRWEARPDILPDGLGGLRSALGDPPPPLAAHIRHLSAESSYVDEFPCWVDGGQAHPSTPALYEHWLDTCVAEGIETFEHDWLVECFVGVRQLREEPGRATAWLRGIDEAAAARGRTLQWCMATLADMVTASGLPRVTSVRTSGDHGYLAGPGFLWAWFLLVNRIARPLGLHPFKDVFLSGSELAGVDALLSLLSTGPVGIGDRLGQADPSVVAPCHRADGLLVKPDVPVAALDDAFRSWPFGRPRVLTADSWTDHAAGRWRYVVALNPDDRGDTAVPLDVDVPLAELGVDAPAMAWDWRAGTATPVGPGESLRADGVAPHDWRYWVVAPVVGGVAVIGDPALYATAGDHRIAAVEATDADAGARVTVVGSPGEAVQLACWSADRGAWREPVVIADAGETVVDIRP